MGAALVVMGMELFNENNLCRPFGGNDVHRSRLFAKAYRPLALKRTLEGMIIEPGTFLTLLQEKKGDRQE